MEYVVKAKNHLRTALKLTNSCIADYWIRRTLAALAGKEVKITDPTPDYDDALTPDQIAFLRGIEMEMKAKEKWITIESDKWPADANATLRYLLDENLRLKADLAGKEEK